MPSVLVLGATGIIGKPVALEFVSKGYKVYGLVRTQEKADSLAKFEVIPIISADVKSDTKWVEIAEKVDIIVEAINDLQDLTTQFKVFEILKGVVAKNPKALLLYTSGAMIYGGNHGGPLLDESFPHNTHDWLLPRVKLQDDYAALGAVIVQPSFVHGTILPFYISAIKNAKDGVVSLSGFDDQWRAFVHGLDVARLYVKIASQPKAEVRGQEFLASGSNEKVVDVISKLAKQLNAPFKKIDFFKAGPTEYLNISLGTSQRLSTSKAAIKLGWYPKQVPLQDGLDKYVNSIY